MRMLKENTQVLEAVAAERDAALSELAKLRAEAEWRPIESAPRDGTAILLWDASKNVVVSGCWHNEPEHDSPINGYEPGWAWWVSDEDTVMWDGGPDDIPTHWLPLPSPPKDPAE
jgi:hypothetical protein